MIMDHHFAGSRAVVLHRSDTLRTEIARRLDVHRVAAQGRWPELDPEDAGADFVILDVDHGHDAQLLWAPGAAPMPVIGLIGSESPGRLQWALDQDLDAFLPRAALGHLFSALVLARAGKARRLQRQAREAEAARRASMRLDLARAVSALMASQGVDEAGALKRLRALAMIERVPLEDAACLYLAEAAPRRSRA